MRNEKIKVPKVLLIDAEGEKLGVTPTKEALIKAREAGLDLVLVAPTAKPPVAKIMDLGKYLYEKEKREKEAKKNQKKQVVKEMKFRLRIDDHDFDTKVRKINDFLKEGQKVRAVIMFLGRDIMFKDKGKELIDRIIEETSEYGKLSRPAKMVGRDMDIFLEPIKAENN
ncbi:MULTISPECIES: translation initiation factor IF-3 [Oceanotoga]|uniref:translation initiation factor IF-3 n=1 Tax=Oceanotoga TaxID=1255275 RepID=UPI00272E0ED2|nr:MULTISPECIES: translation initiation factor IF-3 [Oceanotoga]